jgi:hypothetical protein
MNFTSYHIGLMISKFDRPDLYLDFITKYPTKIYKICDEEIIKNIAKYGNICLWRYLLDSDIINSQLLRVILNKRIEEIDGEIKNNIIDKYLFKDKYNMNDLNLMLFSRNMNLFFDALLNVSNLVENFTLETHLFLVLLNNNKYDIILYFASNKMIKDPQMCFGIFIEFIRYNNNKIKEVYKLFIDNMNMIPIQ